MTRYITGLVLAYLGDRFCERIRSTQRRWIALDKAKAHDGLWFVVMAEEVRRPWQPGGLG